MKTLFITSLLTCAIGTLFAQQVKLGDKIKFDLHSPSENLDRTIFIQLPKDYGKVDKAYPLILLFDAQDRSLYN